MPGTATASRDPAALELNEPGTPCIGLVYLTDIPKRLKVKDYDYVIINHRIDQSIRELAAIVDAERLKTSRLRGKIAPWQS